MEVYDEEDIDLRISLIRQIQDSHAGWREQEQIRMEHGHTTHNSMSCAGLELPRSPLLMAPEPTNAGVSSATAGVLKGCVTGLVAPVAQRAVVTPDSRCPASGSARHP